MTAQSRLVEHGERLRAMTASLTHRGPDAQRAWLLDGMGLGHTRLSIVDLSDGHQPMQDERTGLTVVFNGEIFNHVELRAQLADRYPFRTRSDTEVILAAFLEEGIRCVDRFIGQWAFALFDPRDNTLFLARDPVGKRPLFYTQTPHGLAFASEIRALFAGKHVAPAFDPRGVKDTLTLWAPLPGTSCFRGVQSLPPGCVARLKDGKFDLTRTWDLDLSGCVRGRTHPQKQEGALVEELGALLEDAVRLRLRADVPVAAYLSGGLDSSVLCALAQKQLGGTLQTFSVGFEHPVYDERRYQEEVSAALGTAHHSVLATDAETGALLPDVVSHAEQILLRSAPAPLFKLSRLVRAHETKVVLTGEGSDEIFWGYDIFKETQLRRFWARQPASLARAALFRRLYPYTQVGQQSPALLQQFFGVGFDTPDHPAFSHLVRWTSTARTLRFLSGDFAREVEDYAPITALLEHLPERVKHWRPLLRAQYLEMTTFLSGYLLSAQGDRMLMGNSVEGRFPFLDPRVIRFAAELPEGMKLRGLQEKYLLRRYATGRIPPAVLAREKHPYRAPIAQSLCGPLSPAWMDELLSAQAVERVGVFDGGKVEKLLAKLRARPQSASESDSMALMAVASTQLLARSHLAAPVLPPGQLGAVELCAR